MKALRLSSIALCLLGMFSSCTKDSLTSSSQESLNSTTSRNGVLGENRTVLSTKVDPSLTVTYSSNPATKGQDVTVTGTFDSNTGVAVPDCGKLQLQQLIDGQWVGIGSPVDVTTSNHQVTYTFKPTIVGVDAYSFKVHYIAAGCTGFSETKSAAFPLTVTEPCLGLNLESLPVEFLGMEGAKHKFRVTYRVTSCLPYANAKLQGGLTAVSSVPTLTSANGTQGEIREQTNNDNFSIRWYFQIPSNYSNTFSIEFSKELKGTGPHEITGNWSVEATDPRTGEPIRVETPSVVYPG